MEAIRNAHGERLDVTLTGGDGGRELVVIGHGVTANKDREWAIALAEALASRGLASLRMSFAGNGDSEGRFEDCTISKEVADLTVVLEAFGERRLAYAGHSMGGAVGVLAASRNPRIEFLVSLAGMVHTAEFARRKFGELQAGVDVMWDKPECPLSQTYLDDMVAIDSVVERGDEITVPWLLVHGDADTVVPLQDSLDIRERASHSELITLEGVDHVFSGDGAAAMAEPTADWLRAQMRG